MESGEKNLMRLKVVLPTRVLVDEDVTKIKAEGENGHFCLLPRHLDFVSALTPGILSFVNEDGEQKLMALDEGVLVKAGAKVFVSTANGVLGEALGELRDRVEESYRKMDESTKKAVSAAARLESDLVRRFVEMD